MSACMSGRQLQDGRPSVGDIGGAEVEVAHRRWACHPPPHGIRDARHACQRPRGLVDGPQLGRLCRVSAELTRRVAGLSFLGDPITDDPQGVSGHVACSLRPAAPGARQAARSSQGSLRAGDSGRQMGYEAGAGYPVSG